MDSNVSIKNLNSFSEHSFKIHIKRANTSACFSIRSTSDTSIGTAPSASRSLMYVFIPIVLEPTSTLLKWLCDIPASSSCVMSLSSRNLLIFSAIERI
ncbi:hypothetical protein QEE_1775 [Clostridioides difficile CD113]|nr:hypothetical protein QEE_1775 [Clostridioides difficile CD113]